MIRFAKLIFSHIICKFLKQNYTYIKARNNNKNNKELIIYLR